MAMDRATGGNGWQEGDLPEDQPAAIIVKQRRYQVKFWYQVAERTIEAVGEIRGGDYSFISMLLDNDADGVEGAFHTLINRFSGDPKKYRYKIGNPPQYSFNSKNLGRYEARNIAKLVLEELKWDFYMSWSLDFEKVVRE